MKIGRVYMRSQTGRQAVYTVQHRWAGKIVTVYMRSQTGRQAVYTQSIRGGHRENRSSLHEITDR